MQLHPILKTIVAEYLRRREQPDWPTYHGVPCPYLFPFLAYDISAMSRKDQRRLVNLQTGTVNYHLKNLIKKAGINKPLSSHVARHSFADSARRATGPGGEKLF